MTQKQADYDKALIDCKVEIEKEFGFYDSDIVSAIFRKGYEYGKKQSTADHERNLIALGDDYMTAREKAIQAGLLTVKGKSICEVYRLGWGDADAFDEEWLEQHPKVSLDRILYSHPEIIENEVKARMKDIENEQADHFRDSTKMMRYEIAKVAMQQLMPYDADPNPDNVATHAVAYADALIKELGKE